MSETTITPEGEVDVATAPAVREQLHQAIDSDPGGTVRVDLAKVTFLDSTALGVLISGLKRARAADGELYVANVASNVRKVFEITGLGHLIRID